LARAATRSVAIIGLGPKGLYCLERLCAQYKAARRAEPLQIHIFDRSPHLGTSPIYDPRLADHILVNISVGEIDVWDAVDPPPAAGRGPGFLEWFADTFKPESPLTGDEYLPRSVVGRYFIDAFRRLRETLPPGITLAAHSSEVIDVECTGGEYEVRSREGVVRAEKILLATGHSALGPSAETLRAIPPGARAAFLGIGLTFIDAVLELTEGRGGRFVRSPDGSLSYESSRREPGVIYPFSRSGLPMTPKSHDIQAAMRPLTFLTRDALKDARDFERDVMPLIELEMKQRAGDEAFDYRRILDPIGDRAFGTGAQYNAFIDSYMEEQIAIARLGQAGSGAKAAIELWYEIRHAIGEILPFGGLSPESHRALIEEYSPRFKRVAFGPPVINIEKLLALLRAGILDFSVARSPRVHADGIHCATTHATVRVAIVVDARCPPTDVARDATPLYQSLVRRGIIAPFQNGPYVPGAIAMTEGMQFVIGSDGRANEDIAVVGIPTEGNLIGNLTIARGEFPARWAREVLR
jgi:uncharacterized NAD(P)/FAD-binding protein YdhS